jgi:hypothetical protein
VSELDEDDYYKILELKSVWIQNRVSPILKALTFQGDPGVRKLVDAIEHFKEKDGGIDRSAPTGFLDPEEQTAVNRDGKFRVSLYKALLFLHVQNGIKSGALNLEHSYKYRPLDDYLIDRDRWQRTKQQLIERAGLEGFVDPRKTLKELDEALYQQYLLTDRNIAERAAPSLYSNTSPTTALCRSWKSSPPSTASRTTWMNCNTPNSATTMASPRKPRFMRG